MDPFSKAITIFLIGATLLVIGILIWLNGISNQVVFSVAIWFSTGTILIRLLALIFWHVVRIETKEQLRFSHSNSISQQKTVLSLWLPLSASKEREITIYHHQAKERCDTKRGKAA